MKNFIVLGALVILTSCGGKKASDSNVSGVHPIIQYTSSDHSNVTVDGEEITQSGEAWIVLNGVSTDTKVGNLNKPVNPNLVIIAVTGYYFTGDSTVNFLVDLSGFTQKTYTPNDILKYIIFSPMVYEDLDSKGTLGFTDGTNFFYSEDTQVSKDVEALGSKIESKEVESMKDGLISYGLSVERTEKLAKLMTSYKNISNKRSLNASEKDSFTKELLGMSFDKAAKEMTENYEGLIEKAADKNGTSPEAVKEIINEMLIN
jgi:hypothetical protein